MFGEEVVVEENKVSLIKYHCSSCDGSFYTNDKNVFNKCIFCHGEELEKENCLVNNNIRVLPFNKEYKDVRKDYLKIIKLNPLIPIDFKKRKNIAYLQKVYVPALISNISYNGEIEFIGGEKGTVNTTEIVQNKMYEVIQKAKFNYDDVILKISSKVDDQNFSKVCDFDLSDSKVIEDAYFDDSYYLLEDISLTDISNSTKEKVSKHAMRIVRKNVNHTMKKVKGDNVNIQFENTREFLLPIYILNIKYRNTNYAYIMNGQNGKSYFSAPIGIVESIIFGVLSFSIIFLIGFLISYFL